MPSDPPTSSDLAGALSSRICHDLVSPVGAVVNGIDLMREIGAAGLDQEVAMIGQSADRASGLLQFYRLAFGEVSPDAEGVSRSSLRDRAYPIINWQRTVMDWSDINGPSLQRSEAKLLCQLLLCARAVAGMSGTIRVELGTESTFPVRVTVLGDGASDADSKLAMLRDDSVAPTARLIEFPLARQIAADLGAQLDTWRGPGHIGITAQAG